MNIGLALGGGGARGLCMIEFCKLFDELGIKPSVISGTSIGAIIGAFYAAGFSGKEMEERLENLSLLKIPKLVDFKVFSTTALLKGHRIAAFLRSTLGRERFEQLNIRLKVCACEYYQRKQVVFNKGPLIPAIRASMSLPLIFDPVVHEQGLLIDGGLCNPLPHDLIRDECEYLIAIDVSGSVSTQSRHKPRMYDSVMNAFESMQSAIINEKLRRTPVECYVKPALENFGIMDFHREKEIRSSVALDVLQLKKKLVKDLSLAKA